MPTAEQQLQQQLQQQLLHQQQAILRMQQQAQMGGSAQMQNLALGLGAQMNGMRPVTHTQTGASCYSSGQTMSNFSPSPGAPSGSADTQPVQTHPFSLSKGWFAFHSSGRQLQLIERMHCLLQSPETPLHKTPGKNLGDVIRWISHSALKGLGVPKGTSAFELLDLNLFRSEIFPQGRSSSFRKFAKDWGIVSPRDASVPPGSVRPAPPALPHHLAIHAAIHLPFTSTYALATARACPRSTQRACASSHPSQGMSRF